MITIVHVDGREKEPTGGILAILESIKQTPNSKGLLLSPLKPSYLPEGIEHRVIPKLSYFEYSMFMIYGLHDYVETDFIITVQDDGWVINGNAWRDDFLNYDYIGAPIHLARVTTDGLSNVHKNFTWTREPGKVENVFNGGFSLRSRKFLEAPARYQIPYIFSAPIGRSNSHKLFIWEDECNQEDVQICLYMRARLEKHGIKFPSLDIAKYFSFEHLTPTLHEDIDLSRVLGHHSYMRKIRAEKHIEYQHRYDDVKEVYGEMRILEMMSNAGYTLSFRNE